MHCSLSQYSGEGWGGGSWDSGGQWLAIAVASVLLLRQGGRQEQEQQQDQEQSQAPPRRPRRRILGVFCMGVLLVPVAALAGVPTPHGRFAPQPWPTASSSAQDAMTASATTRPP
jgi:hypothetical protein